MKGTDLPYLSIPVPPHTIECCTNPLQISNLVPPTSQLSGTKSVLTIHLIPPFHILSFFFAKSTLSLSYFYEKSEAKLLTHQLGLTRGKYNETCHVMSAGRAGRCRRHLLLVSSSRAGHAAPPAGS